MKEIQDKFYKGIHKYLCDKKFRTFYRLISTFYKKTEIENCVNYRELQVFQILESSETKKWPVVLWF